MKPDTSARQVNSERHRSFWDVPGTLERCVSPRSLGCRRLACTQRYDLSRERGHRILDHSTNADALALWQTVQIGNEHRRIACRVLPDVMSATSR